MLGHRPGIRLPACHPLSRSDRRLGPGLVASPGDAAAQAPGAAGRRHPRRRPHAQGRARLVRRPGRGRRAHRRAVREEPRSLRRGRSTPITSRSKCPIAMSTATAWITTSRAATCRRSTRLTIDLAVIGGTGVYRLAALEDDESLRRRHRLWPAVGAGARRHHRRPARRLPRAPRRGPLGAAAPGQLPRQPAPAGRSRRATRARASTRSVASPSVSGRAWWPCRTRSSTTPGAASAPSAKKPARDVLHVDFGDPYTQSLRVAVLRAAGEVRHGHRRWRLLRRHPGPAPGNAGRNRPHAPRRLRPGRHDRHARSRTGPRDWASTMPAWRWSPTGRPAAASQRMARPPRRSPWPRCWPMSKRRPPRCRDCWKPCSPSEQAGDCQAFFACS